MQTLPSPGHLGVFLEGFVMHFLEQPLVTSLPARQHFEDDFGVACKTTQLLNYPTNSTLTAVTLYSGIFATGSSAACVNSLAEASGKWKLA